MHPANQRGSIGTPHDERQVNQPDLVDEFIVEHVPVEGGSSLDHQPVDAEFLLENPHEERKINMGLPGNDDMGAFFPDRLNPVPGAASHTAIAVGASGPSTFASSGMSAMLQGITRNGLLPGTSRTVRNELSIRMVLAPTMMASYAARVV